VFPSVAVQGGWPDGVVVNVRNTSEVPPVLGSASIVLIIALLLQANAVAVARIAIEPIAVAIFLLCLFIYIDLP